MTKDKKSAAGKRDLHPEMMGDETEEQNLNQPGNPKARIKKDEVEHSRPSPARVETPGNKIRSLIPPIAEFASGFARSRTLQPAVAAPTKEHLSGTCAQK